MRTTKGQSNVEFPKSKGNTVQIRVNTESPTMEVAISPTVRNHRRSTAALARFTAAETIRDALKMPSTWGVALSRNGNACHPGQMFVSQKNTTVLSTAEMYPPLRPAAPIRAVPRQDGDGRDASSVMQPMVSQTQRVF